MSDVERYLVLVGGEGLDATADVPEQVREQVTAGSGLSCRRALGCAYALLDAPGPLADMSAVVILEERTRELRARWTRRQAGWAMESVPGWLP
jgi:hypothetical protein